MKSYGGQTMVGPLLRVLVCPPAAAGWNEPERAERWEELGYLRAPDFITAQNELPLAHISLSERVAASTPCMQICRDGHRFTACRFAADAKRPKYPPPS